MSKKHTRDLSKFATEKRNEGGWLIPWGDTAELSVPAAAFWPKEAREAAKVGDAAESMRHICGDDFDAFVELTGEDDDVIANLIYELIVEEAGVPLGKSSDSSTS